ncbi:hypothetical protein pb186bvf_021034 [Paramecium bursaria]
MDLYNSNVQLHFSISQFILMSMDQIKSDIVYGNTYNNLQQSIMHTNKVGKKMTHIIQLRDVRYQYLSLRLNRYTNGYKIPQQAIQDLIQIGVICHLHDKLVQCIQLYKQNIYFTICINKFNIFVQLIPVLIQKVILIIMSEAQLKIKNQIHLISDNKPNLQNKSLEQKNFS